MMKSRLARAGRTHKSIFTVVASDTRSPRDGKFLEKLGQYDPAKGATISDLKVDSLKKWVQNGAIVTPTVKNLLKKDKVQL